MKVEVHFYERGNLLARLVRWWTYSPWSHVEVAIPQECHYVCSPDKGLYKVPVGERGDRVIVLELPRVEAAKIWAEEEMGCSYDWWGAVTVALPWLRREHPSRWHCAEFVAAFLDCSGESYLNAPWRTTPAELWERFKDTKDLGE